LILWIFCRIYIPSTRNGGKPEKASRFKVAGIIFVVVFVCFVGAGGEPRASGSHKYGYYH
jgi:hypothetical protein